MARYQRGHSGPNLSKGMMWILGICAIAYMAYKIISCNRAIKSVSNYEMQEMHVQKARDSAINDSTNEVHSR